jgi:hypothetical protein
MFSYLASTIIWLGLFLLKCQPAGRIFSCYRNALQRNSNGNYHSSSIHHLDTAFPQCIFALQSKQNHFKKNQEL